MVNELRIKLQPKQKEAFRLSLVTPVTFYGGAKGGGKSYLIRAKEVYLRFRYPGSKGLIVRKTYPELRSNHILKFFEEYPLTRKWFNKTDKTIYWPNGSTTEFSYLQTEDDVYTYQGREYENISIDESTQHTWASIQILRSSLRTTRTDMVPTMLLTGNPGGVSHMEHKRIFVDKRFKDSEAPDDFKFIQAFVSDNAALSSADPAYIKRLEDLPEHLKKAYLDGDWNIFAGQAFSELSPHVHLIDPFELPPSTRWIAGFDPGYNHPFSFVLAGVVPDGQVYVTQHYTGRLKTTQQIVDGLHEHLRGRQVDIYAGHDLWYPGRGGGAAEIEQFRELLSLRGYKRSPIIKAKTAREQGVAQIRKYITLSNPEHKPMVYFFKNGPVIDLFNVLLSMQFDQKRPEDVVKVDADEHGEGGDDPYDAFRYLLMSRTTPNEEEIKKTTEEELMEMIDARSRAHRQEEF